ncbi:uncharacterized protein LOC135930811 [Gordionus sp. m RMFG-2023]|uniref:uncharacterized protein LOC135930811 n=1 Tax=Gordionus sp. m RMFG-2023 TaxID=3053472 RepID=UPI0031FD4200
MGVKDTTYDAYNVTVSINSIPTLMQVDTGTKHSTLPKLTAKTVGITAIRKTDMRLTGYDGSAIKILGLANVNVKYEGNSHTLEAIVVDCDKIPLLGRVWLYTFNILKTFLVGNVENDLEKIISTTKKDLKSTYSYKPKMVRQEKVHLKLDAATKIILSAKIDATTQKLDCCLKHDKINLARKESRCPMPCTSDPVWTSCLYFTKPSFGERVGVEQFITIKEIKVNLSLIQVPLNDALNINIQINNKDDLIYLNKKISGSAAKIGSKLCYHHCTLLVNSDLNLINDYLTSQLFPFHIECKATKSVRSKVENLININPTVDQDTIIKYIAKSYLSFYKNTENNIFEIEPNEKNFPGIYKAIQEFKSWEWLYGKTPKFSLSLIFDNDIIPLLNRFNMVKYNIEHGYITQIVIKTEKNVYSINLIDNKIIFDLINLTNVSIVNSIANIVSFDFASYYIMYINKIIAPYICERLIKNKL